MTDQASREAFKDQTELRDWLSKHVRLEYSSIENRYKFPSNDLYDLLVAINALTHANTEMEKMREEMNRYKEALEDVREKAVKGYEKPELGGRYTSIVFRIDEALYTDPSEALPPTPKAEG